MKMYTFTGDLRLLCGTLLYYIFLNIKKSHIPIIKKDKSV